MNHHDDSVELLSDVVRGRLSRRDLLRRAAALGLAAPTVVALLGAMPEGAGALGSAEFVAAAPQWWRDVPV